MSQTKNIAMTITLSLVKEKKKKKPISKFNSPPLDSSSCTPAEQMLICEGC